MSATEDLSAPGAKDNSILTSLKYYTPCIVVGFILFEYGRKYYKDTYNPKHVDPNRRNRLIEEEHQNALFGWIRVVLSISDDELMEYCGLDALILVHFQHICMKIAFCSVGCGLFLIPIYGIANPKSHTGNMVTQITVGNINEGHSFLWFPTIAIYVISFYTMYLLRAEYIQFVERRHQYMRKLGPSQYSVVLSDIPQELQSESALSRYMRFLFLDDLHSVTTVCEISEIDALVAQRDLLLPKFEHAMAVYLTTGNRPTHRIERTCCCCGGKQVDSIDTYKDEIQDLNNNIKNSVDSLKQKYLDFEEGIKRSIDLGSLSSQISQIGDFAEKRKTIENDTYHEMQKESEQSGWLGKFPLFVDSSVVLSSAFISFKSLKAVMIARQLLQSPIPFEMSVTYAPHPEDINWPNLGIPFAKRDLGLLISTVATSALIILWSIPSTAVASLSNVEELQARYPFLESLFKDRLWLQTLVKQLPTILLPVLLGLVPPILRSFSHWECQPSKSATESSMFKKYSIFLITIGFLATIIAGTISGAVADISKDPMSTPRILGTKIPEQSVLFMGMVYVRAVSLMVDLLRVNDIVMGWFWEKFAPKLTERERNSPWLIFSSVLHPKTCVYSVALSVDVLYLVLVLTYSVLSPLMAIFGAIQFSIDVIVHRRQMVYIYDYVDNGGVYWHQAYSLVIIALILGQLTLLGVVSIKGGAIQAPFFIAIILCTVLFHMHILSAYPTTATFLAISECIKTDKLRKEEKFAFLDEAYRQESLKSRQHDMKFSERIEFDTNSLNEQPPPQRYNEHPPPQRYNEHPPPQQYNEHPPPQQYNEQPQKEQPRPSTQIFSM